MEWMESMEKMKSEIGKIPPVGLRSRDGGSQRSSDRCTLTGLRDIPSISEDLPRVYEFVNKKRWEGLM